VISSFPPSRTSPSFDSTALEPASARRRPFGVYAIALLQALNAITHGAGVVLGLEDHLVVSAATIASDAFAALYMVVGIAVAAGLLLLKRWAWVATMLWVGGIMAAELVLYFRNDDPNYAVMALSVAQVFYLNLSDVQGAFARRRPANESRQ
jgi:hypothetical protein